MNMVITFGEESQNTNPLTFMLSSKTRKVLVKKNVFTASLGFS